MYVFYNVWRFVYMQLYNWMLEYMNFLLEIVFHKIAYSIMFDFYIHILRSRLLKKKYDIVETHSIIMKNPFVSFPIKGFSFWSEYVQPFLPSASFAPPSKGAFSIQEWSIRPSPLRSTGAVQIAEGIQGPFFCRRDTFGQGTLILGRLFFPWQCSGNNGLLNI